MNCLLVMFDSLGQIALIFQGIAETKCAKANPGSIPEHLLEVINRLVQASTRHAQSDAKICVAIWVLGIEIDGLLEVLNRLIEPLLRGQGLAKLLEGSAYRGIKLEAPLEVADFLVQTSSSCMHDGAEIQLGAA